MRLIDSVIQQCWSRRGVFAFFLNVDFVTATKFISIPVVDTAVSIEAVLTK